MKKNNKGFTLLELLIAATIIGILAVFATVAYRESAAETRLAGAKAQAEALANAVQRYRMDPAACTLITSNSTLNISNLVNCGYLEKSFSYLLEDPYFSFEICAGGNSIICPSSTYLACMSGKSEKLPNRYLAKQGYLYCFENSGSVLEIVGAN